MIVQMRIFAPAAAVVLVIGVLAGLPACTSGVRGGSESSVQATSGTPTPAAVSCPPGVEDAARQGLKAFGMYGGVTMNPASASDAPLAAVANNLSGALCVVGFVGTNGAADPEHGTVAFLPAAQKDAVVSALQNIGYMNRLDDYTYTQGGQITSGTIANVTITPADYWSVDFTPLFSQPIVVVTTTKR